MGRGVATVLTMVSGELDYQDIFGFSYDSDDGGNNRNIPFPKTALFVWVLFIVLTPIILNNMLVSGVIYNVYTMLQLYIPVLYIDGIGSWGHNRFGEDCRH